MLSSFKKTSAISAAGYGKMFIKDVNGWTHSRPAIAQEVAWNTHCLQTSLTISLGEDGRYIQHFWATFSSNFAVPDKSWKANVAEQPKRALISPFLSKFGSCRRIGYASDGPH